MDSVISSCARAGVAEWVCCPGELNAPLLTALAHCPSVHRWHIPDERSAGFFALGRIQATSRPVAVLTGGAAAAASLMPAVIEAYYQRRPLIIVTADDEVPVGDVGAYARAEQDSLFGVFAPSLDFHLPCPLSDLPDLVPICAEGFPLHLRLCCSENLSIGHTEISSVSDPPPPPAFRSSLAELSTMLRFCAHEGLVLLLGALDPEEQESVLWLARTLRVPVLADATSGLREKLGSLLLLGGNDILLDTPPPFVLRVGSVPSFPFWRALEDISNTSVFSITRSGFSGLRRPSSLIEGDPEQIMKALDDVPHVGDPLRYLPRSRSIAAQIDELLLALPESDASLVRSFSQHAALAEVLFLGSPTASTLWNQFAQLQAPTYYVRSTSLSGSSDGAISAFLANSVGASFACALIGDLSFLRDSSAAEFISQLPTGKRIIGVLNNEGAGLALQDSHAELRRLIHQPPLLSPADFARLLRADYYPIRSDSDLDIIEALPDDSFAVLDLIPDPAQSLSLRKAL